MKNIPIVIALFAAGFVIQSSGAQAMCKRLNVAAVGFGHTKGVANSLAWESWEAGVEKRGVEEAFQNSDNVGSPSVDCSPNKSGKYSGRGVVPSSMGDPGSAWVCEVSGTPCDGKK